MSILVTATTSLGKPLTLPHWKVIEEACDLADRLEEARKKVNMPNDFEEFKTTSICLDILVRELSDEHACTESFCDCWTNDSREAIGCGWWSNGFGKDASFQCSCTSFQCISSVR